MDLKGAKIRNFYNITQDMREDDGNSPKIVKIPHYQRPYKWTEDNVKRLIDDWERNLKGSNYFAGSIVTVSDKQIHELIDGQQRYTTIFLVNFIQFLLCRVLIRQAILENRNNRVEGLFNTFIKSGNYLFLDIHNLFLDLAGEINNDFDESLDPDAILDKYKKSVNLPYENESHDDFLKEHYECTKRFLEDKTFILQYDRKSFNVSLKNVLARCCIKLDTQYEPTFHFYYDLNENNENIPLIENEQVYKNTIETIFEIFNKKAEVRREKVKQTENKRVNTFDFSKDIVNEIGNFLEEIKLCVIQTGNADDAYTLFEVLNDRSLALDDLDLIKNLFYKKFVLNKNIELKESEKDEILKNLDDQWVDKIFKTSESAKKLIAYLAIVYITGSTEINYKTSKEYREKIKIYLDSIDSYTENDIKRDFNIFNSCAIIVDKLDIRFKSTELQAIKAEYNQQSSIFNKTVHMLVALKQEGVLSGLINFILQYIQDSKLGNNNIFDIGKVNKFIELLLEKSTSPKQIEDQSKAIWKSSILSKDYTIPREFAIKLIETNNSKCKSINLIDEYRASSSYDEYKSWVDSWSYNNRSSHFKIKILFAKLIPLNYIVDTNKLETSTTFRYDIATPEIEKLNLDHLEPSNLDNSRVGDYFFPKENRDYFINGLGNMMILSKEENIQKSNKPLKDFLPHYKCAGLGNHFLVTLTTDIFYKNKDSNSAPTEQFFNERKAQIIDLFKQAIDL